MDILQKYLPAFFEGALTTLLMASTAWVFGGLLGVALGFRALRNKALGQVVEIFGFFISAVPVLVLLFWVHYPLQSSTGVFIDPLISSIALLTILNSIFVSQAVLSGGRGLPVGYLQCARVYGLSPSAAFLKIELPLILRAAMPAILNAQVAILHMTLFASLISVEELFRVAQRVNAVEYQPVAIYTIVAGFYITLSVPVLLVARRIRAGNTAFLGQQI